MKRAMAWHKDCLKNQQAYLKREREILERHIGNVEKLRIDVICYAQQIALAEERGLNGFDRDKLGKKRKGHRD